MALFVSDCAWDGVPPRLDGHSGPQQRVNVIHQRIEDCDFEPRLDYLMTRRATEEEVESVHTKQYIEDLAQTPHMSTYELERFCKYKGMFVNRETFDQALLAAGSVINMAKEVWKSKTRGFAAVRSPGHHASADAGCGVCVLNNVAIAAKQALAAGAARVLIVDWDVHAGQGTQDCVRGDERIQLLSIHRIDHGDFWSNLQQCAIGTEFDNTVNVPLNDVGMTDSDYLAVLQLVAAPMIQDFQPELILVSCGFDAALGDPDGEMCVTPAGYGTMAKMLINTGIPTAFILEGGFCSESLAANTEYVLRALLGDQIPVVAREPMNPTLPSVIRKVYDHHQDQYPSFRTMNTLVDLLNPLEKQEEKYFARQRALSELHATRELRQARSTEAAETFEEQLDDIVNGYTKAEFKEVVMKASPPGDMSISIDDQTTTLLLPKNLLPVAAYSLQLALNPLNKWQASSQSTLPSSAEMARFANFLNQNSHIKDLQNIPVHQL